MEQEIEELQTAVQEYLQSGDSQLLLVAIAQHVSAGHSGRVASLLLLPQHKDVVKTLGWDLLSLLTPHLPPLTSTPSPHLPPLTSTPSPHLPPLTSTPSPDWQLVTLIAQTCSPKEMCLAFLEQLELVSTTSPLLFFHLLTPLHTVLVRLGVGDGGRQVSALRAVHSMLDRLYPSLTHSGREREQEEEDDENEQEEQGSGEEAEGGVTLLTAAGYVVELVEPFVAHIHQQFASDKAPLQTFWTPLQRECVGLLLTLLGEPLVSCDLQQATASADSWRAAETIMSGVVRCHCGCLQLLEYEAGSGRRAAAEDDEIPPALSAVGVACFVYLVLAEGVQSSYLPSPLHPHHLLHTSLTHTLTLLHRQKRRSIWKGLALLESVLCRVSLSSLPAHTLTSDRYLKTAQCLVDIMVTCPHKELRQKSVAMLPELIRRFSNSGRHRFYRSLLHSTSHAGVQGLLIQGIKNEVDCALKVDGGPSPFLGVGLVPFLDTVLTYSPDQELLRETDRVMAGLNFLRYLLIRDKPQDDRTGVWGEVGRVRSKFIQPLRQSLERNKLQCRGEMERQREGDGDVKGEGVPGVSVAVMGEELPNVTPEEQIKMLRLAEYQLDMMECVLVRVEELLDNTS